MITHSVRNFIGFYTPCGGQKIQFEYELVEIPKDLSELELPEGACAYSFFSRSITIDSVGVEHYGLRFDISPCYIPGVVMPLEEAIAEYKDELLCKAFFERCRFEGIRFVVKTTNGDLVALEKGDIAVLDRGVLFTEDDSTVEEK